MTNILIKLCYYMRVVNIITYSILYFEILTKNTEYILIHLILVKTKINSEKGLPETLALKSGQHIHVISFFVCML